MKMPRKRSEADAWSVDRVGVHEVREPSPCNPLGNSPGCSAIRMVTTRKDIGPISFFSLKSDVHLFGRTATRSRWRREATHSSRHPFEGGVA